MIDLRNTCILVRTKEENEMLLKEAEKQGFHWYLKDDCKPLLEQHFPDILRFCKKTKLLFMVYVFGQITLSTKHQNSLEQKKWQQESLLNAL